MTINNSKSLKSIHLQDFPDVSFIKDEKQLVEDMDLIKDICSTALFIRDQQNLRVRLPLNKLTIIGNVNPNIIEHKDIIAEEINVKNIEISNKLTEFADLKLQINFKKVGTKFGQKMKKISMAAKQGQWEESREKTSIIICGEILKAEENEFEIKLVPKNQNTTAALQSNDCVVQLDTNITKELEEEGIARDIIRYVQEKRKKEKLDISDHIQIIFRNIEQQTIDAIRSYEDLIKENTLAEKIEFLIEKEKISELSDDSFEIINLSKAYKKANA